MRLREKRTGPLEIDDVEKALSSWAERPSLTPKEEKVVATHEAGHAVAALFCPHSPPIDRISIRGDLAGALGFVSYSDPAHRYVVTRHQLLDQICTLYGGREAELLFFDDLSIGSAADIDRATDIARALVEQFAASPEAATLRDTDTCRFVMDSAADYFRATIATLGPSAFEKIVFEIIPRKMYVDPSEASEIVEELRALYAFLKREFGLKQADACLRVLGDDAVKKLEVALADRTRFGMAKMFVTQGRDAGFAVDTKEGLEAWMRFAQASGVLGHLGPRSTGSAPRPTKGNAQRAKKDQRKAQRAARKRNR
jgi:hypothetical protein